MPFLSSFNFYARSSKRVRAAAATLCAVSSLSAWAAPDWSLKNAELDSSKPGSDGKPSLKIAPGGSAILNLGSQSTSGTVTMEVWDDGSKSIEGKDRGVGPRWGISSGNGRVLVGGIMYAPYLSVGGSYCIMDADPKDSAGWFNLKYFSTRSKTPRWQKWEFIFDANAGLTLKVDGKVVPEKRFNWNESQIEGMNGVVIYGDDTRKPGAQTLWVGNINAQAGPKMAVKPAGAQPKEPIVPAMDPAAEKVWSMKPEFQNSHPRLLISKSDLPKYRAFYNSGEGKPWRDKIEAYLPPSTPPKGTKWLKDATDGQRQGLWRLPTVALHYLMTGDETSLNRTKGFLKAFYAQPHWETTGELDSGMSAANIMIGAALAYDWIYDELDPEFREQFREKLFYHARAMYYGGHLKGNKGTHYWQNDPANNHRWHRNAGMTLSILAIYEGRPEEQWILDKTIKELAFINEWLPADGSCHEGPGYFLFGGNHLTLAMDAADKTLGTKFLDADYFKRMGEFRAYTLLPGMKGVFSFGDGGTYGMGGYNNFLLRAAGKHQQSDIKDMLYRLEEADTKSYMFGWFNLLWDDPSLPRGDMTKLPTKAIFEDVGFATMRESWEDDAVAASFICGPFGGHHLLKYTEGGKNYINVAHDDPDALEFQIAKGGNVLVATDGYSKHKASRNHNTFLINGMGQMSKGRPEGGVWSQPGGDMSEMAYITLWKVTDKITVTEGEAAGSYLSYKDRKTGKTRPQMDRVRRSFIWVEGDYILVLDEVRAPSEVEMSWLIQSDELTVKDEAEGRFVLSREGDALPMQIVADASLETNIQLSPADNKGKNLGLQQLRASANTSNLRVVSIYDPWERGALTVQLKTEGPDSAAILVTGNGIRDVWQWKSAADNKSGSMLKGIRQQGNPVGFPFQVDSRNKLTLP
ncbi:hypothetical protein P0Y35_10185 [Kiritimatiellaeota bacterium B1221]|nr:hypothetical protein [Kiritimatiellaeota bacterium B1221]